MTGSTRAPRAWGRGFLASALALAALLLVPAFADAQKPWPRLGFNGYYPTAMTAAPEAGATTSRIFARWAEVEKEQGALDWSQVDQQYNHLVAAGMPPIIVIMAAPDWARPAGQRCFNGSLVGCWFAPAPEMDDEWAEFAAKVTERYPEAVAIEIWNEENSDRTWTPGPDPARYVEVARAARDAIKEVDPGMPVVMGGPGPFNTTNRSFAAPDFLHRVYQAGGRGVFDAIGVHAYPTKLGHGSYLASARSQIDWMEFVTEFHKDPAPLWITEVGISTTGGPGIAATPQEQARELGKLYMYARELGVEVMIVHKLLDGFDLWNPSWGYGFGLLYANHTPKPAFCVFASLRGDSCRPPR